MIDRKRMQDVKHMHDNCRDSCGRQNVENAQQYLSDEELEMLIAAVEAEPMLHPPGEFKNEIIGRLHRKRERHKNLKLFSYSVKVFAAAAAAIGIMLVMPENIRMRDSEGYRRLQMWQDERMKERHMEEMESLYGGEYEPLLYEKMDDYCSQLNSMLNQLIRMEDN